MLMAAYRPIVKVTKAVHKQIQVWPEGSSEALQDCFNTTDWNMFKQAATYNNTTDLQEYSETVTAYITKCIDDVTVTKTVCRAGDEVGLRTARANLSRGIREAKGQSILHFLRVREGQRTVRVTRIASSEQYSHTARAPPPDFCNCAYFVCSGRTCALKLFCSNHVFPHGGNTVPGRCFTVENETKETD